MLFGNNVITKKKIYKQVCSAKCKFDLQNSLYVKFKELYSNIQLFLLPPLPLLQSTIAYTIIGCEDFADSTHHAGEWAHHKKHSSREKLNYFRLLFQHFAMAILTVISPPSQGYREPKLNSGLLLLSWIAFGRQITENHGTNLNKNKHLFVTILYIHK